MTMTSIGMAQEISTTTGKVKMSVVGYMGRSVQMSYDTRNRVEEQLCSDGRSMNYTYGNRTVTATGETAVASLTLTQGQ